ncbi:MFS transporter [uncultured Oxalicibacterium sp.]|uniref:NTP/NDP exchange transporter n=1 Tax=uncultured Oxalicibacterium sp. TaxID=1168540 RepID=UPI0025F70989|nr:MFS transporter [uncultured Oxalicibacterium sp.]
MPASKQTLAVLHRFLGRFVDIAPQEMRATLLGFTWFFCLLGGYYLLRPLRDAMGLAGGEEELQWLFTATFLAMLTLVPLFGMLVARFPPRRFVPIAYRFFTASILCFCVLIAADVQGMWVARVFFVWISVFNLFVISIFWSVLADCFSNAQGRRLFGFIAAGGTAGTFVGPALAATLVTALGPVALTLVAALMLEIALQCFYRLMPRSAALPCANAHDDANSTPAPKDDHATRAIGGNVFAGLGLIVRSPYLLGLCGYLLLHTAASTFLYFEQGRIVASSFADTASRTRFFALVDLGVSSFTLFLQLCITGRFIRHFGLAKALLVLPLASALAFMAVALSPTIWVLAAAQALRRAFDYAIARPAREVLFTVVAREAKYKAKNAIETVVYRGGDALSGWISAGLGMVGVGFAGLALLAVPLAGLWAALSVWLARRQEQQLHARNATSTHASRTSTDAAFPS